MAVASGRELERRQSIAELAVERLRTQLDETADKRTRKRLERELDQERATAESLAEQITDQARLEIELWTDLWKAPQAVAWEEFGLTREVALYVRFALRAEDGDVRAAAEARQRSDRLGLSPLAMLRLRWEIEQMPNPGPRTTPDTKASARDSLREDPRIALHVVS